MSYDPRYDPARGGGGGGDRNRDRDRDRDRRDRPRHARSRSPQYESSHTRQHHRERDREREYEPSSHQSYQSQYSSSSSQHGYPSHSYGRDERHGYQSRDQRGYGSQHGYQQRSYGRDDRGSGGGGYGGRDDDTCRQCGQSGHFARDCPQGRGGQQRYQQREYQQTTSSSSSFAPPVSAPSSLFSTFTMPDDDDAKSTSSDDMKIPIPLSAGELCERMKPGNVGRKIKVTTNYYRVNTAFDTIYSYLCSFKPEIAPNDLYQRRREISKFASELRQVYGKYVFDGSTQLLNLYHVEKDSTLIHADPDPTLTHELTLRFIKALPVLEGYSNEVDMVVNVLFKQQLRAIQLIQFGRAYYQKQPLPLQQQQYIPLQLHSGFQAAIHPTLGGLQLCIDLSHKVIQRRNVRYRLNEIEAEIRADNVDADEQEIRDQVYQRVQKEFKGAVVITKYNHRTWRIDAVDFSKTMDDTFTKDNKAISFRDYTIDSHATSSPDEINPIRPPYKALPGLLVNYQKKKKSKKENNQTYFIPELCYLTGISDAQRTDQKLMKMLADATRKGPSKRVEMINRLIHDITTEQKNLLQEEKFPLTFVPNATVVEARILHEFKINYITRNGREETPVGQSFAAGVRFAGFETEGGGTSQIRRIGFVTESRYMNDMKEWSYEWIDMATRQMSVSIRDHVMIMVKDTHSNNVEVKKHAWKEALEESMKKNVECLICIVPDGNEHIYGYIKHATTLIHGIVTQCIHSKSLHRGFKLRKPVMGNSIKQIMAKLNHMLWKIDLRQVVRATPHAYTANTMFVGVDVSHDKKSKCAHGSKSKSTTPQSTVGFVATMGNDINQYYSQVAVQGKYDEYVHTSCELMINALKQYYQIHRKWPERVVVYRDGVGNSQLTSFVREEINLYKQAFTTLKCSPAMTVVVVQKRITVRFFSECNRAHSGNRERCNVMGDKCDGNELYHSPIPGTVVDTDVTSSLFSDFYLIPSICPKGATSRPTRFIVMQNDINYTTDDLQGMTNSLCYMYYNWPGPIRVPAMCMYAHKLAYLFGKYLDGQPHDDIKSKLFYI